MNQYLILAAAIAAFAAGAALAGTVSSSVYSRRLEIVKAEAREQLDIQRAKVDAANLKANTVAAEFERWKKTNKAKVVVVEKEVARVLQANPDWSSTALPDSLRDTLRTVATDIGAAEPDDAVQPLRQPAASGH